MQKLSLSCAVARYATTLHACAIVLSAGITATGLTIGGPLVRPVNAQQTAPELAFPVGCPVVLFDGWSLEGWGKRDGSAHPGWVADQGALHRKAGGGDLYFRYALRDFDLNFEWKIASGGNSGVKYRVREYPGHGWLGCEYQLLDDSTPGDANKTGGLYDVFDPPVYRPLVKPGEWNRSRIVVCGSFVGHWLNGVPLVQARVGDPRWRDAVADSKFADVPGFGENRSGRLFFQDHGDPVWFRNVVLVPLRSAEDVLHFR